MGWQTEEIKNIGIRAYAEDEIITVPDDFCPTEDFIDAGMVIEKLKDIKDREIFFSILNSPNYPDSYFVTFMNNTLETLGNAEEKSVPLAICIAALKIVGVEVER